MTSSLEPISFKQRRFLQLPFSDVQHLSALPSTLIRSNILGFLAKKYPEWAFEWLTRELTTPLAPPASLVYNHWKQVLPHLYKYNPTSFILLLDSHPAPPPEALDLLPTFPSYFTYCSTNYPTTFWTLPRIRRLSTSQRQEIWSKLPLSSIIPQIRKLYPPLQRYILIKPFITPDSITPTLLEILTYEDAQTLLSSTPPHLFNGWNISVPHVNPIPSMIQTAAHLTYLPSNNLDQLKTISSDQPDITLRTITTTLVIRKYFQLINHKFHPKPLFPDLFTFLSRYKSDQDLVRVSLFREFLTQFRKTSQVPPEAITSFLACKSIYDQAAEKGWQLENLINTILVRFYYLTLDSRLLPSIEQSIKAGHHLQWESDISISKLPQIRDEISSLLPPLTIDSSRLVSIISILENPTHSKPPPPEWSYMTRYRQLQLTDPKPTKISILESYLTQHPEKIHQYLLQDPSILSSPFIQAYTLQHHPEILAQHLSQPLSSLPPPGGFSPARNAFSSIEFIYTLFKTISSKSQFNLPRLIPRIKPIHPSLQPLLRSLGLAALSSNHQPPTTSTIKGFLLNPLVTIQDLQSLTLPWKQLDDWTLVPSSPVDHSPPPEDILETSSEWTPNQWQLYNTILSQLSWLQTDSFPILFANIQSTPSPHLVIRQMNRLVHLHPTESKYWIDWGLSHLVKISIRKSLYRLYSLTHSPLETLKLYNQDFPKQHKDVQIAMIHILQQLLLDYPFSKPPVWSILHQVPPKAGIALIQPKGLIKPYSSGLTPSNKSLYSLAIFKWWNMDMEQLATMQEWYNDIPTSTLQTLIDTHIKSPTSQPSQSFIVQQILISRFKVNKQDEFFDILNHLTTHFFTNSPENPTTRPIIQNLVSSVLSTASPTSLDLIKQHLDKPSLGLLLKPLIFKINWLSSPKSLEQVYEMYEYFGFPILSTSSSLLPFILSNPKIDPDALIKQQPVSSVSSLLPIRAVALLHLVKKTKMQDYLKALQNHSSDYVKYLAYE